MKEIKLTNDTINSDDINKLIEWLKTNPKLTKGEMTMEFEKKWSKWQGRKYSVYLNSGSSANLSMLYSLLLSNKLKNKNIVVPSVSWSTTVSPVIQLGMKPILCECDKETLGIDIDHFKEIIIEHNPSVLIIVHVLAFPNKMDEIIDLCVENDIILLEDSCESIGSEYKGIKTGNFGLISSFSLYFGHHISTIEGGIVCTDNFDIYQILLSIRSHGWGRDLDVNLQNNNRNKYDISDFKSLYTFYYPGFNFRSTDLQAFIGIGQIDKLDEIIIKRNINYFLYDKLIKNDYWKIKNSEDCFYSNYAYPIIHEKREEISKNLEDNNIECRPLICGSIGRQPYWINLYGVYSFDFADKVDEYGLYLPNHSELSTSDIEYICDIVNETIKK